MRTGFFFAWKRDLNLLYYKYEPENADVHIRHDAGEERPWINACYHAAHGCPNTFMLKQNRSGLLRERFNNNILQLLYTVLNCCGIPPFPPVAIRNHTAHAATRDNRANRHIYIYRLQTRHTHRKALLHQNNTEYPQKQNRNTERVAHPARVRVT